MPGKHAARVRSRLLCSALACPSYAEGVVLAHATEHCCPVRPLKSPPCAQLTATISHLQSSRAQLSLDQQPLDSILDRLNLALQLPRLIRRDAGRNHWAGHSTGTAQCRLRGDKDVGDVLVLA